jgi:endonuclease/exonuclease/phosphatase family metal-dependent hydrolase
VVAMVSYPLKKSKNFLTKVKKMLNSKPRFGLLGYLLRLINGFVIFALLGSYFSQWISPQVFWPIAFLGLTYPIFVLLNLYFVLHWLIRRRRFYLFSLIALVLGFPIIGRYFQFGANSTFENISKPLKVVSYNVHVFDRYHSKYDGYLNATDEILKIMETQSGDIYCFQEFFHQTNNPKHQNLPLFKKTLATKYSCQQNYSSRNTSLYLVIVSKFPIIKRGTVEVEGSPEIFGVYADIQLSDSIIRVYSVHLESYQISGNYPDMKSGYDLTSEQGQMNAKKTSVKMAHKFKRAFVARSQQVEALKKNIDNSPYPVIVAGDFNDTPISYAYAQISRNLDDAYQANGSGTGQTYIGPYPSFRIDYILHDTRLINYQFETVKVKLSDHYPIAATFSEADLNY